MPIFNDLHSLSASVLRLGAGMVASRPAARQPEKLIELYEFESCPFCRKAREAFTVLDIDFISRTCARGSANRARVVEMGTKAQFPFLVDPNTGASMYESEDIARYLAKTYGDGSLNLAARLGPLNTLSATFASAARPFGGFAKVARQSQPAQLLELWSFEASPYCRKVREELHRLDLDFVTHNVGKKSLKRPAFVQRSGRMQVPYLEDPNTGTALFESDDIVSYLRETYGD